MQQYFDLAKQVVPKNLTTYFNTIVGAINVLGALKNKFYPEYMEVQDSQNFQTDDPTQYSCIYLGSEVEEINKRKSFNLKKDGYVSITKFLGKFTFERLVNTRKICYHFFDQSLQCCYINLDEIFTPDNFFLICNDGSMNKIQLLNQGIDELALMLLEYVKGLYHKENIRDEYIISFGEIQDFIYKQVRKRARKAQSSLYKQLIEKLDKYCEQEKKDQQLVSLSEAILQQGFQLQDIKILIEQFMKCKLTAFYDQSEQLYGFSVTHVILVTHLKKLRDYYLKTIMDSFRTYIKIDNEIYYSTLQERIESIFVQYLTCKQFDGGITDKQFNKPLQYLIYSIDWIQASAASDGAMEVLIELSKYHENVYKSDSQIAFTGQQFSVDILNNFKFHNRVKCNEARKWWQQNVLEEINILIIFQVYCILSEFRFVKGQLQIGTYSPQNRIALCQILRVLNNGKYHYLNQTILKLCENMQHQIEEQIHINIGSYQELRKQQQMNQYPQSKLILIRLKGKLIEISLHGANQNAEAQRQFKRNDLFYKIIKPVSTKGEINKDLMKIQDQIIQGKLKEIQQQFLDVLKCDPPSNIKFEVLSEGKNNSNVITLLISGFLSGDGNKQDQWQGMLQQGSGTVVALHWNCSELIDFAKSIGSKLIPQVVSKANVVTALFGIIDAVVSNPYESASKQAVKVGRYLAYLIAQHKIFGDRQINIVVHSLGSVILLECVRILDKIFEKEQRQYINQVMIMGGVADVRKLQKRRWNSVAGNIYNIYTKNDGILKYILQVAKFFDKPCGYKPVINCDFTDIVNGHYDYRKQLIRILIQSDFNNDFKYLTSEVKELF